MQCIDAGLQCSTISFQKSRVHYEFGFFMKFSFFSSSNKRFFQEAWFLLSVAILWVSLKKRDPQGFTLLSGLKTNILPFCYILSKFVIIIPYIWKKESNETELRQLHLILGICMKVLFSFIYKLYLMLKKPKTRLIVKKSLI